MALLYQAPKKIADTLPVAWIAFGQIDALTTADMVVAYQGGRIDWYQAPATFLSRGRWRKFTAADENMAPAPKAGFVADLDNDGAAEIVFADSKLRELAILKAPTGSKRDKLLVRPNTKQKHIGLWQKRIVCSGVLCKSVASGDLDGDGVKEIVAIASFKNNGDYQGIVFEPADTGSARWKHKIVDKHFYVTARELLSNSCGESQQMKFLREKANDDARLAVVAQIDGRGCDDLVTVTGGEKDSIAWRQVEKEYEKPAWLMKRLAEIEKEPAGFSVSKQHARPRKQAAETLYLGTYYDPYVAWMLGGEEMIVSDLDELEHEGMNLLFIGQGHAFQFASRHLVPANADENHADKIQLFAMVEAHKRNMNIALDGRMLWQSEWMYDAVRAGYKEAATREYLHRIAAAGERFDVYNVDEPVVGEPVQQFEAVTGRKIPKTWRENPELWRKWIDYRFRATTEEIRQAFEPAVRHDANMLCFVNFSPSGLRMKERMGNRWPQIVNIDVVDTAAVDPYYGSYDWWWMSFYVKLLKGMSDRPVHGYIHGWGKTCNFYTITRSGFNKVLSGAQGVHVWLCTWYGIDPRIAAKSRNFLYGANCGHTIPLLDPHFPSRRDGVRKLYRFLAANQQYYIRTKQAAQVAVYFSYDTSHLLHYTGSQKKGEKPRPGNYEDKVFLPYKNLCMMHVPTGVLSDPLRAEYLSQYKLIIAPWAEVVGRADTDVLREWVRHGGCLVAYGGTSKYNERLEKANDYWLGDALAVRSGKRASRKTLQVAKEHPALASFSAGERLKPPAAAIETEGLIANSPDAQTVMKWSDGSAAMVVNCYGKGASVAMDFDPGILSRDLQKRLLANLVAWRCGQVAGAYIEADHNIDMNLLKQDNRLLLHIVNYTLDKNCDTKRNPIGSPCSNIPIEVAIPESRNLRRLYMLSPNNDEAIEPHFEITQKSNHQMVQLTVPKIDIYCLIVLELKPTFRTSGL